LTWAYPSTDYYHGFIGTVTLHSRNGYFRGYKTSVFSAYHVPTSLSFHIPLGVPYGFVDFPMPKTSQGFSYTRVLLILIYQACTCSDISIS